MGLLFQFLHKTPQTHGKSRAMVFHFRETCMHTIEEFKSLEKPRSLVASTHFEALKNGNCLGKFQFHSICSTCILVLQSSSDLEKTTLSEHCIFHSTKKDVYICWFEACQCTNNYYWNTKSTWSWSQCLSYVQDWCLSSVFPLYHILNTFPDFDAVLDVLL